MTPYVQLPGGRPTRSLGPGPVRQPGVVRKFSLSVNLRLSCGVMIRVFPHKDAKPLALPLPGSRTFGRLKSLPIVVGLMFPYMSICAPPK
jgi:hypothetical protein